MVPESRARLSVSLIRARHSLGRGPVPAAGLARCCRKGDNRCQLCSSPSTPHFPGYRRQVMGPALPASRRVIPRTGNRTPHRVSRRNAHAQLRRLAFAGLLEARRHAQPGALPRKQGARPIYSARSIPILRKTSGFAAELKRHSSRSKIKYASHLCSAPWRKGSQTAGGDIDVLVGGTPISADVVDALYPVQRTLGRRDQSQSVFAANGTRSPKQRARFTTDVLGKPKVFLVGDENELARAGRKSLDSVEPSAETVNRLLDAAARPIADGGRSCQRGELRFCERMTPPFECAISAFTANGYRTRSRACRAITFWPSNRWRRPFGIEGQRSSHAWIHQKVAQCSQYSAIIPESSPKMR